MKRVRRRILQERWRKARYAKLEQSQAFAYHSSLQPEVDCSLRTEESTIPTSEDMMPPLPVPPPEPVVVCRQVTTRGRGTRSHPYFVGDHFNYTRQVLEGVGVTNVLRGSPDVPRGRSRKSSPADRLTIKTVARWPGQ